MTKKTTGERELVLGILMEVLENGQYSHIVLRDVLSKYQYLDKKERAFITRQRLQRNSPMRNSAPVTHESIRKTWPMPLSQ